MKIRLIVTLLLAGCFALAYSQIKTKKKMNTIVLVHGAWMSAASWKNIVPPLEAAGHEVITVELPGHGNDHTAYDKITLQSYVDAVKKAIGNKQQVTLVGHSMGGIVITQTAEQIPSQIKELVYIGAFLPRNGESLYSLSATDKDALLGKYMYQDDPKNNSPLLIKKEGVKTVFAEDAPEKNVDQLVKDLRGDALAPFVTPVNITNENAGSVRKVYVFTTNDKAVSFANQQLMVANTPVSKTYALPSSHVPFFSMPEVVTGIILHEAQ